MAERVLPAIVLVLAGFYLLQSLKLPLGTTGRPGAGFYPVAVAVFACVMALAATVQAFLAPRVVRVAVEADPDAAGQRRRVVAMVAALAGFCLVMPWIGYPASACAFVIAGLVGLGSRWPTAVAMG